MLKVPQRRKLSRKSQANLKPNDLKSLRKNSKNISSIVIHSPAHQQYSQLLQTQDKHISNLTSKKTIFQEEISHSKQILSTNSIQQYKLRRTLSIRPSQQEPDQNRYSQLPSTKFSKIESTNLDRIKTQDNLEATTKKSIKPSTTLKSQKKVRESALKKSGKKLEKQQSSFLKNTKMKKASNFHHENNWVVEQEPQTQKNQEKLFKQHNPNDLEKDSVCGKITETNQFKAFQQENQQQPQLINKEVPSKYSKLQNLSNHDKENRNSNNLLKKKHPKYHKRNQNRLLTPKFYVSNSSQAKNQEQIKSQRISEMDFNGCSQKAQDCRNQQLQEQEQMKMTEELRIKQEQIDKERTEELFRQLAREISAKEQIQNFHKKSENYYEKLRLKLKKKYDQISKDYRLDETQKEKIGLLIEGCNLQRHRRVNNFYFQKKQQNRSSQADTQAISQATRDISNLNFVSKSRNKTIMRPQTSRTDSTYKMMRKTLYENPSIMLSDYITMVAREQTQMDLNKKVSKTMNKLADSSDSECIFNLTNPDMKSRLKLRNTMSQLSQTCKSRFTDNLKESDFTNRKQDLLKDKKEITKKFKTLIDICEGENDEHKDTKQKMKAFEYYCKKIDNGFEKLSQRITSYVSRL